MVYYDVIRQILCVIRINSEIPQNTTFVITWIDWSNSNKWVSIECKHGGLTCSIGEWSLTPNSVLSLYT